MSGGGPAALTGAALAGFPDLRHGFFTRVGGVSRGVYASLNCGPGSADDPAAVAENRARATVALGVPASALRTVRQVHGIGVAQACAGDAGPERPAADALVAARPGLALGILTADCAPVLFADPEARVAGAAHAGWRGALAGVLARTVEEMERLGARRRRIRAAVGPCIGRSSYEVGPEFAAPFEATDAGNGRWFSPPDETGRRRFDLEGYVAARLAALGLAAVSASGRDTCAEADAFFSYRRSRLTGAPGYGRALSAIVLAP